MPERPCPFCNQSHEEGALFCPNTGQPLPPPPPIPVARFCVQCGTPCEPEWRICPNCGASLPTPGAAEVYPARAGQTTRRMRRIPTWIVWFLGVLAALGMALLVAIFALGLNENNRTARVVPAGQTYSLISFSPTLAQLPALLRLSEFSKSVGVFGAVPGVASAGGEFQDDLYEGFNPQKDLLPWIGNEISLAIIDTGQTGGQDTGGSSSTVHSVSTRAINEAQIDPNQLSFLLTAATRSKSRSNVFLQKFYQSCQEKGATLSASEYRGTSITEIVYDDGSQPQAVATYHNLVMIGSNIRVLQTAIDTANNPQQSLYAQKEFQEILERLPANRLGMFLIDWNAIQLESGLGDLSFLNSLFPVKTVAGSFSLEPKRLGVDYLLHYDPDRLSAKTLQYLQEVNTTNSLARYLPDRPIFYLAGSDLPLWFESELDQMVQFSETGESVDTVYSEYQDLTGMDFRRDLMDYLPGEYMMAFIPGQTESEKMWGLPFIPLFVIQTSDPGIIETNFKRSLDAADESTCEGSQPVDAQQAGSQTIWHWVNECGTGVSFDFMVRDGALFISTSDDILNRISNSGINLVTKETNFGTALSGLPRKGASYMILDVQNTLSVLSDQDPDQFGTDFQENTRPYLESIDTIGWSSSGIDTQGFVHGRLLVNIR